jgi:hypothetical protein
MESDSYGDSDNRNYRAVKTASSGRDFDDTSEIRDFRLLRLGRLATVRRILLLHRDAQRTTARSAIVAQLVAAAEMN